MPKLAWIGALVLLAAACDSHANVICEKIDTCGELDDATLDDCSETVEKRLTTSEAEDCAECMEEESCSSIFLRLSCVEDCPLLFTIEEG